MVISRILQLLKVAEDYDMVLFMKIRLLDCLGFMAYQPL